MSKLNLIAEPGKQDITISRVFNAPRDLVFKTFLDPNLIPKWWGDTTVDKMEVRPGGMWRFVSGDGAGNQHCFHGFYHSIVAPERAVYTFEYEGMPGHVLLETVTFEEHEGKTTLMYKQVFQSVQDRDGMLGSGMEAGSTELLNRLEQLLENLKNSN